MFFQVDKIPYVFRQATNFRYLTGSKSNDSALVLRFNGDTKELHSTLILPVSLQFGPNFQRRHIIIIFVLNFFTGY